MLEKSKRLNLKKDFKWVASGKKIESQFVKLFFKIGENPQPRIGIASSSATFKKANQRNKARRLVSTGFEDLYTSLISGVNIVALPKAGILEVKSSDVVADLKQLLENEKLTN